MIINYLIKNEIKNKMRCSEQKYKFADGKADAKVTAKRHAQDASLPHNHLQFCCPAAVSLDQAVNKLAPILDRIRYTCTHVSQYPYCSNKVT